VTGQKVQDVAAGSGMELVKRRLLSGGVWALGGWVTAAVMALASSTLLARLLSPAELGTFFLAYSVVGLCTAVGALGLIKAIVRFVAESVGLHQYVRTRRAIRLALGFGSLGAFVVGLSYLLFGGRLAASLFDSPALAAVAGVTAGWIVVSILQGIMVETFRGFHDIRLSITLGGVPNGNGILTSGLLSLMLLMLLLSRGEANLATVMLLAATSGAASALLAGFFLRRRVNSLPQGASGAHIRASEIMHVAWPLMITNVALLALAQSTLWIVGAFLPQEEVALYGAAYRLTVYVGFPLLIANMVTPPLIAEMHAQSRTRELEQTLRTIATTAGIPAFLVLTAFVLFGEPIMGLLFGDYYREAGVLLSLLSLGQIVNVAVGSCQQALMMTGNQVSLMVVALVTSLLMVAGGIWSVQHYGVTGVAAIAAAGLILQSTMVLLVARKKLGIWTHVFLTKLSRAGARP
jgi:O-antigen/teichoic acid export membrane protein